MARFRSSGPRCFNGYSAYRPQTIVAYARTVVFFVVYLGILIALCVVRKRIGAGKRLIGWAYMGALFFMVINCTYGFILSTLSHCEALNESAKSVYDTNIASLVFSWLQTMLFLYVVFYHLNMMLRKQLGQNLSALRIVLGIDVLILGILLFVSTVMLCYFYYSSGRGAYGSYVSIQSSIYIILAFDAFQVTSILLSGIVSMLAARSLKKKNMAPISLLVWVSVLHALLLICAVWSVAANAGQMFGGIFYGATYSAVMTWIQSFCYAVAYISIIVIARNPVWTSSAFA